MRSTIERKSLKVVKSNTENNVFSTGLVSKLLNIAENAENNTRNEIENMIVSFGDRAVPELVERLFTAKGVSRGIAAMCLIRIGSASIAPLKNIVKDKLEHSWIAEYLIREIEGSKKSILANQEAMVG